MEGMEELVLLQMAEMVVTALQLTDFVVLTAA
jgi:hypothetical protein